GETATIERIADLKQAATEMAQFIAALHGIDAAGGPAPGDHNSLRGVPLVTRDAATRTAISSLHGMLDEAALTAAWDAALNASVWNRPPVWIHGDLQPDNGQRIRVCRNGRPWWTGVRQMMREVDRGQALCSATASASLGYSCRRRCTSPLAVSPRSQRSLTSGRRLSDSCPSRICP